MGLLDDAIREHLELKRLRGADPGEVAREQREALDPVVDERDAADEASTAGSSGAAAVGDVPVVGVVEDDAASLADASEEPGAPLADGADDGLSRGHEPGPHAESSNAGEETAELDMRPVLQEAGGEHITEETPER